MPLWQEGVKLWTFGYSNMRCGQMNRCLDYTGFQTPSKDFSLSAREAWKCCKESIADIHCYNKGMLKDNLGNLQR